MGRPAIGQNFLNLSIGPAVKPLWCARRFSSVSSPRMKKAFQVQRLVSTFVICLLFREQMDVAKTILPCSGKKREIWMKVHMKGARQERAGVRTDRKRRWGAWFFTQVKPYFTSGCCNTSSVSSSRETDINEEGREVKKQGVFENKGPNPQLWKLWHRGSVCTACLANNLESCKMWMRESSELIISHPWGKGDECELKEDRSMLAVPRAVTPEQRRQDRWLLE